MTATPGRACLAGWRSRAAIRFAWNRAGGHPSGRCTPRCAARTLMDGVSSWSSDLVVPAVPLHEPAQAGLDGGVWLEAHVPLQVRHVRPGGGNIPGLEGQEVEG